MFDRQRWHDHFLERAQGLQITSYNRLLIIAYYLLAAVMTDQRGRVDIYQQIGVNMTRLAKGVLKRPVKWLAMSFFNRALIHSDLRQHGAILRDQAELLSKIGQFDEAQKLLEISIVTLLQADDHNGITLTRIIQGVTYYRQWDAEGRSDQLLLQDALKNLARAWGDLEEESETDCHQLLLAKLWLADVYLGLYESDGVLGWLKCAREAAIEARRLAEDGAGSTKHLERAEAQLDQVVSHLQA